MASNRIARIGVTLAAVAMLPLMAPGKTIASGTRQDDPEAEERTFTLELGRKTFEANCLMCHSSDMVTAQRLTPEQWAAEVEKMIGWGSPVPPEEKERLVNYLIASFPSDGEAPTLPRLTLEDARAPTRPEPAPDALPSGDPDRGAALVAEHCATCHGADGRGGDLGQNLIARPVLFQPATYADILHEGRRRMPGFQFVLSPQEMADTLAWLRSRSVPE
ncbi:c-type cytochrome [Tautonia sociabilis]|uniref:Cytochrome c n=1 Tax=Tautonia sociabilis TaxID=2080755 RepID=A0A432MNX7_9BACT|nr:cytochrome c [Tautonia sociabilis]RUL88778.1 cytochrome c [Tautonia sociabilis]